MKCLLLQVNAWLHKVFCGKTVPAYEVSDDTLDLLTELKQACERQEKYNELILQDLQLKADEYRAEGICFSYINEPFVTEIIGSTSQTLMTGILYIENCEMQL